MTLSGYPHTRVSAHPLKPPLPFAAPLSLQLPELPLRHDATPPRPGADRRQVQLSPLVPRHHPHALQPPTGHASASSAPSVARILKLHRQFLSTMLGAGDLGRAPWLSQSAPAVLTSRARLLDRCSSSSSALLRVKRTDSFLWDQHIALGNSCNGRFKLHKRLEVVCLGMLAPRKFMQRRRKIEVFKDAADEADQKNWRKLMLEIEESGSAVTLLRSRRDKNQGLPKDVVLGTLVRFKQLKKWNLVSEILEWLRTQHWWDFNEMDLVMLMTAYGKQGDFVKAERTLAYINKKGYPPNVVAYTALMEAYGKGGQHNKAEAVFRRMQTTGPEPSAITYQIMLKIFVEGNKFEEADDVFQHLMVNEKAPLKPDQKMFHMMIYMHKKAGNYDRARQLFSSMTERGIEQSTVTYNSLMSFETNYKEVSRIYDQMQRAGLKPDVVSYALLVSAYGKARREDEALAVFEEMLDAGVRPTQRAYNILLDAFAISGMVEQARTVFKSMRRDRCTPDLCSYTTMLSAYINASDMEGAEKFFKRIIRDGIKPNVVTYGTLIKGYARTNDVQKMMEKYEELQKSGIKANQTIFTTIMDAHGKNIDFGSAVFWFKEMETNGCPPDQKAKNILLSLAKTDEEKEEANLLVGNVSYDQSLTNTSFSDYSDDEDDEASDYDSENDDDEEEEGDDREVDILSHEDELIVLG